jgi:isopenicillin N synthase-like dioxygenase
LVDLDLSIDTAQIFHTSKTFFDLEESEKSAYATQSYVPNNPNAYRGYFPVIPNSDTFKEGFEFGWRNFTPTKPNHPLHEASVFPHSLSMNWQSDAQAYFEDMLTLGNKLLNAYEIGLGLNEGRLTSLFSNSMSTLRFIRYPERTETASISEILEQQGELTFSTPSHADSGILTLLLQDNTGGLQALSAEGNWLDIEPIPNTLVMNLGALLETLTDGAVKATQHRVISPTQERYSIPFFFEPSPDAIMTPVLGDGDNDGEKNPLSYEEYLVEQMKPFAEYEQLLNRIEK